VKQQKKPGPFKGSGLSILQVIVGCHSVTLLQPFLILRSDEAVLTSLYATGSHRVETGCPESSGNIDLREDV